VGRDFWIGKTKTGNFEPHVDVSGIRDCKAWPISEKEIKHESLYRIWTDSREKGGERLRRGNMGKERETEIPAGKALRTSIRLLEKLYRGGG